MRSYPVACMPDPLLDAAFDRAEGKMSAEERGSNDHVVLVLDAAAFAEWCAEEGYAGADGAPRLDEIGAEMRRTGLVAPGTAVRRIAPAVIDV